MTKEKKMSKFPNYFPVERLPDGAKEEKLKVYRFCKWGKIDKQAFYSNYEEALFLGINPKGLYLEEMKNDIDMHSTSTYENLKDVLRYRKCFTKHEPDTIIVEGCTETNCGLTQRTSERKPTKKSHVDWWIYEAAEPHNYFKKVEL